MVAGRLGGVLSAVAAVTPVSTAAVAALTVVLRGGIGALGRGGVVLDPVGKHRLSAEEQ